MILKNLFLLTGILLCNYVSGQNLPVTGKVTNAATGQPLGGVTVRIRSADKGTLTNNDGTYRLEVPSGGSLEFTAVGFNTVSANVSGRTEINIQLTPAATELSQIVLVGTRAGGRAKTETPVPVDVISVQQAGLPSAKMELTSLLNAVAPSFNYNKQSGSDGADQIELATLRGLGPDQTLVLINGKRRHQTAFVSVFGTRGRGNSEIGRAHV